MTSEVIEALEDPETLEDPELEELMKKAENMVAQAYTQEDGEIDEAYLEQAENILEQYQWVKGIEKEGAEYSF